MAPKPTVDRLDEFMETWISNPAAQRDFVRLVAEVLEHPRRDHADQPIRDWVDDRLRALRSIGIR